MNDVVRLPSNEPEPRIERFEQDLKHVLNWDRVDENINRLRFRKIGDVRIGVVLATWSERYANFALNVAEVDRLRKGKSDGRVDLTVVVAVKDREHCCHVELGALYERVLRHKTPRPGDSSDFWTLNLGDIMGEEAPF